MFILVRTQHYIFFAELSCYGNLCNDRDGRLHKYGVYSCKTSSVFDIVGIATVFYL